MIVGIEGLKDQGKTLTMSLFLWMEQHYFNKPILSNYKLLEPLKFEYLDANRLVELDNELVNSVIGIDEIHMLADCRNPGKKQNKLLGYFFLQSRHRGINIYYTTQFISQTDKRIRDNTDIKVICQNLKFFNKEWDGFYAIKIIDERIVINTKVYDIIFYGKPIYDKYNTDYYIDIFNYTNGEKKKKGF